MCISVERWKAISNPLAIPYWRTHYIIVVVWLISCVLSIPEPLTLRIYPADYARKNLSTTVPLYEFFMQFETLENILIAFSSIENG